MPSLMMKLVSSIIITGLGRHLWTVKQREKERLDLMHYMTTMTIGDKLHLAPIGLNPLNILDIGTGTGTWCLQMGMLYSCIRCIISSVARIAGNWWSDRWWVPFCAGFGQWSESCATSNVCFHGTFSGSVSFC
jgi:hypothetical protein